MEFPLTALRWILASLVVLCGTLMLAGVLDRHSLRPVVLCVLALAATVAIALALTG